MIVYMLSIFQKKSKLIKRRLRKVFPVLAVVSLLFSHSFNLGQGFNVIPDDYENIYLESSFSDVDNDEIDEVLLINENQHIPAQSSIYFLPVSVCNSQAHCKFKRKQPRAPPFV